MYSLVTPHIPIAGKQFKTLNDPVQLNLAGSLRKPCLDQSDLPPVIGGMF